MQVIKLTTKTKGDKGENEVIEKINCPNCAKSLMKLPPGYPLYDIQCTACSFRAQIKTSHSKPKNSIFGAGWEIIDKVIKSGFLIPPLIVNFKWKDSALEKQKIIFIPFVPKRYIRKRTLSENARRANYKMFNYIEILELPHFNMYEK